jgi:hypothetical protein
MFKRGATPSRLVRRIAYRNRGEPQLDRLIRAYFREAFAYPLFRASASLLELPDGELAFAAITADVVHQIVLRRSEWDSSPESPCWMDCLSVTGSDVPQEQVRILSRLAEQLELQVPVAAMKPAAFAVAG